MTTEFDTSVAGAGPKSLGRAVLGFAIIPLVAIGALVFATLGNSARFDDDWLTYSADHIRDQMVGSPTDQIGRAVRPPRAGSVTWRSWTTYDSDSWSMCLYVGDGTPTESRHLIFGAEGDYVILDGTCPAEPTLTIPRTDAP